MASTTTQSNNARVKFRGQREREMAKPANPLTGETLPKAPKTAKPARVRQRTRMRMKKAAARGLISEKAMAKHFGD